MNIKLKVIKKVELYSNLMTMINPSQIRKWSYNRSWELLGCPTCKIGMLIPKDDSVWCVILENAFCIALLNKRIHQGVQTNEKGCDYANYPSQHGQGLLVYEKCQCMKPKLWILLSTF